MDENPIPDDINSNQKDLEIGIRNKLIIHPSFNETIRELSRLKINLPEYGSEEPWDFSMIQFPQGATKITNIEDIKPYMLKVNNGLKVIDLGYPIFAYDESFQIFSALEGEGYIFSHSIIVHGKEDYIPSVFITFYFFTQSEIISQKSKYIIKSDNSSTDSKILYSKDRTRFICDTITDNSIILIDGPLIGGQMSHFTIELNRKLLQRNIIPIFIVKNSNSNLVTQNINGLKGKYNSDMHWCYNLLKNGERTSFFRYVDQYNPNNGKIFCYLKPFDVSPQRIEVHIETFQKYKNLMSDLMDLIYYLLLVQGNYKNPQVRSIAIAEKFARESLKLFNIRALMRKIGLKPTINESRFGGI